MCGFRLSKDRYRLSVTELDTLLSRAQDEGIRYVRFTGGEPLMHRDITGLVGTVTRHGMEASIITNGALLERKLPALARAGLRQVIVSIDGPTAVSHDAIR